MSRILDVQNLPIHQVWLFGEDKTVITVGVACDIIRQLMTQETKTGVHHSEQFFV
ncbi:MAG: hypothetical protein WBC91_24405 [Phototrophicaceae bacterium]